MKSSAASPGEAHAAKCELASEVLRAFGKLQLQVTGWSMLPSVWPGDTLAVERVPANTVSEGDIVLLGRDRRLIAHRVVSRACGARSAIVQTRGDAMITPDSPATEHDVLGRVSFIVRDGRRMETRRRLGICERAVAALVRHSGSAARVIVRIHDTLRR